MSWFGAGRWPTYRGEHRAPGVGRASQPDGRHHVTAEPAWNAPTGQYANGMHPVGHAGRQTLAQLFDQPDVDRGDRHSHRRAVRA